MSSMQYLVSYARDPTDFVGEFMLYIDASGRLGFTDYGSAGYGFGASYPVSELSTTAVSAGIRTYVAFVRNALVGTFYINGVAAGTVSAARSVTYKNRAFCVGANIRDLKNYFGGAMSNVQLFATALTAGQVSMIYKTTL